MQQSELIVRETLAVGKNAKYGNVDLGYKEGISRGSTAASLSRPGKEGENIFLTFLPDTLHNRSVLLQKNSHEVFVKNPLTDKYVPLNPSWLDDIFGELGSTRSAASEAKALGAALDGETPTGKADKKTPKTVPVGKTAAPAPASPAPAAAESAPPEAEASITSVADFLARPIREQHLILDGGVPLELLEDLAGYANRPGMTKIAEEIQEKAFSLATAQK